mgnify:FL=1
MASEETIRPVEIARDRSAGPRCARREPTISDRSKNIPQPQNIRSCGDGVMYELNGVTYYVDSRWVFRVDCANDKKRWDLASRLNDQQRGS